MILVLFGAPGSGKGTQAEMISSYLNIKKISLGDILRVEVKNGTALGEEVKGYMERGELVPDSVVLKVIKENIAGGSFVLDGFPRSLKQAELLEGVLREKNLDIDSFLYIDVDRDRIIDRLSKEEYAKSAGQIII